MKIKCLMPNSAVEYRDVDYVQNGVKYPKIKAGESCERLTTGEFIIYFLQGK
jgi:hypothetical protein